MYPETLHLNNLCFLMCYLQKQKKTEGEETMQFILLEEGFWEYFLNV